MAKKNSSNLGFIVIALTTIIIALSVTIVIIINYSDFSISSSSSTDYSESQDEADVPVTIASKEKIIEENVTLTLPAIMFDNPEEYAEGMRSVPEKVISATVNDDGSITAEFTPLGYKDVCDALAQSVTNTIGKILNEGDYPLIESIDYDKDFLDFKVVVSDGEAYNNNISQRMYILQLKAVCKIYHSTMKMSDADPVIHVYDTAGTEIATTHLNDVLNPDNIKQ